MKIGVAFSDHIKTEKLKKRHQGSTASFHVRGIAIACFIGFGSLLLLITLVRLQVLNGRYYRVLADSNRTRTTILYAPRGILMDRNNTPLVFNTPGFRKIEKEKSVIISREQALEQIAKSVPAGRQGDKSLQVDSLRQYPYKEAFAHVLGYIGQISKEQLNEKDYEGYALTDFVGKTGIEQQYESTLKGVNGKKLVEIDATGKPLRTLGETDPIPGQDVLLTLDARLQTTAYEAMKDVQKGAVIAATPDGQILAMVSKPSYDTNLFTLSSDYRASSSGYQSVTEILSDEDNQPLLDRAISGTYPPGSTFKLVTAAAGLENKIIDRFFTVEDTGVVRVGTFSFANWFYLEQGRTDGVVDVVKGIARSNDIFFYKLAEKVGVDKLSFMGEKFGLGARLGIDLLGEAQGVLPTREWKKKEIGESWYLGDTYHYGIGQGYLLTTPLQVNSWTQTIANGGSLYKPRLVKSSKSEVRSAKFLSENTISLIRQGMVESCSPGGVAYPLFNFRIKNSELRIDNKNILPVSKASESASLKDYRQITVACKTGTAQHGGDETLPHAWITLFAPAYDPEIVVTVLAESSGQGSTVASPIAKEILKAWFESQ